LDFSSTAGLTQARGHLPDSTSDSSAPTRRLRAMSKMIVRSFASGGG